VRIRRSTKRGASPLPDLNYNRTGQKHSNLATPIDPSGSSGGAA
jgi:hypothetical protein